MNILSRLWRRALQALANTRPKVTITRGDFENPEQGDPILHRYYLYRSKNWGLYLHNFVASDPGPELHDHPFSLMVSLVLAGGYYESKFADGVSWKEGTWRRWLGPGRVNLIRNTTYHRVILPPQQDAWTLVWRGKRAHPWGFLFPTGIYREAPESINARSVNQQVTHGPNP